MLAGHAALLAWKAGRPVKMIYDRAEDMVATTKRHPSRTRHRTACRADGSCSAMDIDFVIDGGAYARCRRSCSRAARSTRPGRTAARTCASAAARSRPTRRRTARSAASARRRASSRSSGTWTASRAPSASTPEELRRRNFIRAGGRPAPSARSCATTSTWTRCSTRALDARRTTTRSASAFASASRPAAGRGKGIGFATFMHGAGFTGSGEDHLASIVAVEATARRPRRACSPASTEIGQGTNTIFAQIAARRARRRRRRRRDRRSPTRRSCPNSGPTVASRTVHGRRQAASRPPRCDLRAAAGAGGLPARGLRRRPSSATPARDYVRAPRARCERRRSTSRRRASRGTTRRTGRRLRRLRLGGRTSPRSRST